MSKSNGGDVHLEETIVEPTRIFLVGTTTPETNYETSEARKQVSKRKNIRVPGNFSQIKSISLKKKAQKLILGSHLLTKISTQHNTRITTKKCRKISQNCLHMLSLVALPFLHQLFTFYLLILEMRRTSLT